MYYLDRKLTILTALAFCITAIMLLATITLSIHKKELGGISAEQHLEIAIQEGYATYLDGEQIDIATVDPRNYVITVDNKKDRILLSKPTFWDFKGTVRVVN